MVFCAAFFVLTIAASAQTGQKFFTRDGKVKFDATVSASIEKVEALSNSATCVLDASNGNFQWAVLIKGFKFEKSLMQEHFNENYMESDKYPKATFLGKITNIADVNLAKDGTYNALVSGQMTIHGITKDITANGALTVSGGKVKVNAGFNLKLADYNISIPSMVSDKVAKEVKILVDATLEPKQ
ncbi:MAG: YceI family protein [Phycisphaerae bacterium]|nr:YceI family protein [Saprospiraceae bacterium]